LPDNWVYHNSSSGVTLAHPIIIQDATLRNDLRAFHDVFSAPQWKYLETVLMGMIRCQASGTLSGLLREVAVLVTVSGLSRFLISPTWTSDELARVRYGETLSWLRERNTQLLLKWICYQVSAGANVQLILEFSTPALPVSWANC
jgi:hypothetical protein